MCVLVLYHTRTGVHNILGALTTSPSCRCFTYILDSLLIVDNHQMGVCVYCEYTHVCRKLNSIIKPRASDTADIRITNEMLPSRRGRHRQNGANHNVEQTEHTCIFNYVPCPSCAHFTFFCTAFCVRRRRIMMMVRCWSAGRPVGAVL